MQRQLVVKQLQEQEQRIGLMLLIKSQGPISIKAGILVMRIRLVMHIGLVLQGRHMIVNRRDIRIQDRMTFFN